MSDTTASLRTLDKQHFWHPFTQMQDWIASEDDPVIIASGKGATLTDTDGNTYIDGNSSIWTNIHGHAHPVINAAICEQVAKLSHCSALGFSNEPAIRLAAELASLFPPHTLSRVFFSDDGSTAIECACRMAAQYRAQSEEPHRQLMLAFDGAYHGDTVGAASLGGIGVFHERFHRLGYPTKRLTDLSDLYQITPEEAAQINAIIIEPLVQGAAGIRLWPAGMLAAIRTWCDEHDIFLILDEVMTGFGRTGHMFACEHESVIPDFLCLAKGLTGGYLPMAATMTTERIFSAFSGKYEELKTFFYGHSYCGNPLGAAAALSSLRLFKDEDVFARLPQTIAHFQKSLHETVKRSPHMSEYRQIGLIAGIDLVDATTQQPFDWRRQQGAKVCKQARRYGLLTRMIRDTIVLMPPLCVTEQQISASLDALEKAAADILG